MDASDATSLHSAEPSLSGSFAAGLWRWFTNDRDTRHWLAAERAFADSPASTRRPAAVDLLFGDLSDPVIGFLRLLGRLRT